MTCLINICRLHWVHPPHWLMARSGTNPAAATMRGWPRRADLQVALSNVPAGCGFPSPARSRRRTEAGSGPTSCLGVARVTPPAWVNRPDRRRPPLHLARRGSHRQVCDRVLVMKDGSMVESGDVATWRRVNTRPSLPSSFPSCRAGAASAPAARTQPFVACSGGPGRPTVTRPDRSDRRITVAWRAAFRFLAPLNRRVSPRAGFLQEGQDAFAEPVRLFQVRVPGHDELVDA